MKKIKDMVVDVEEISAYPTSKEGKSIISQRVAMEKKMKDLTVTTVEDRQEADEFLRKVRTFRKAVESAEKKILEPIKVIEKEVKGYFKPVVEQCKEYEGDISQAMIVQYQKEQEELAKLKAKEEAKVESGYQKAETAVDKIEEKEKDMVGKKLEGSSSTIVEKADCEVKDITKVPEEWLLPRAIDKTKVLAAFKADENLVIPGIERTVSMHTRVN